MTFSQLKEIWLHPELYDEILKPIIDEKIMKLLRRELYTKYKTAATEEEREQARQQYLYEVGILPDFRW